MKRWPVIRHIRAYFTAIKYGWQTARRGATWGMYSGDEIIEATKTNPLFSEEDRRQNEHLEAIWNGKA